MAQARNNNNNNNRNNNRNNNNNSSREPWFDLMAVEKKALKGKYSSTNPQVLNLNSFGLIMPHPEKAFKGGEDVILISKDGNTIGVADGVGGWKSQGVDPSVYPRELFASAKKVVESGVKDPLTIMNKAYKENMNVTGSSTCVIATLNGQSILNIANLGDSGLIVIRAGKIVFKTTSQQVSFNFPYQLGTNSVSLPKHSEVKALRVIEGDIIIAASDGLWDNLWCTSETPEVLQIVNHARKLEKNLSELPKKIANELAENIYQVTREAPNTYITPFSMHEGGHFGKIDDVSIIVSRVTKGSSSIEVCPFSKAVDEKFILPQEEIEVEEESDESENPTASEIESIEQSQNIQHNKIENTEQSESVQQSEHTQHKEESIKSDSENVENSEVIENTQHKESIRDDSENTKQSKDIKNVEDPSENTQHNENIKSDREKIPTEINKENISDSETNKTSATITNTNIDTIKPCPSSPSLFEPTFDEKNPNSHPLSEIHNSTTIQTSIESHTVIDTTPSLAFNIHEAKAQFSHPEIAANTQSEEAQTPFKPPTTENLSETQTPSISQSTPPIQPSPPTQRKFQLPLHKLNTTKTSPRNTQKSVNNNNNNNAVLVSPRSPAVRSQPQNNNRTKPFPSPRKVNQINVNSTSSSHNTQKSVNINNNNNAVPVSPRSPRSPLTVSSKNNKPVPQLQPQNNNRTKPSPSPRKASEININNTVPVSPRSPRSPLAISNRNNKPVPQLQPQNIASPSPRKATQSRAVDINNNNNISQTPTTPLLHNTHPITPKKTPSSHHTHCSSPLHFTPDKKIKTTPPRQFNELVPINIENPINVDSLKRNKVGHTDSNPKNTPHTHTTPNQAPFYQETDSYLLTYKNGTYHYHFYPRSQSNQDGDDEDTIPFFVPEFERHLLLEYTNYDNPEIRQSLKDALEPEKHRIIEYFSKQHYDSINRAKQEIVELIKGNQGKKIQNGN